jgi:DMSO reductase anchor subunit
MDLLAASAGPLGWATAGLGLLGVFCSAMIYAVTRRTHWRLRRTASTFFASTVLLGAGTLWLLTEAVAAWSPPHAGLHATPGLVGPLLTVLVLVGGIKLGAELSTLRHLRASTHTIGKRAAILMVGDLARATQLRFALGVLGLVALPGIHLVQHLQGDGGSPAPLLAAAALALALGGELLERYLFFTTAPPSRMPGALS